MARVAVASGTASAVSNRVTRRQASRWAGQGEAAPAYMAQQAPPDPHYEQQQAPPVPQPQSDVISQLKELGELRDQGVLTEDEFAAQKAKLLSG